MNGIGNQWVAAAKDNMRVMVRGKLATIRGEALKHSVGSWLHKPLFLNHAGLFGKYEILGEKYEKPYLKFLIGPEGQARLKAGKAGSIDGEVYDVRNGQVFGLSGKGYSILDDKEGACSKAAGCGVAAEMAGNRIIGESMGVDKKMTEEGNEGIIKGGPDDRRFVPGEGIIDPPEIAALLPGELLPAEMQADQYDPRANNGRGGWYKAGYRPEEEK